MHLHCCLSNFSFRWAAYVAGTILVLMTELGVRFEDSISMLVKLTFSFLLNMLVLLLHIAWNVLNLCP